MNEGQEGPSPKPKLEQARKPEDIEKDKQDNFRLPTFKKQIAAGVLIIGTVGAAGAVTSKIEQDNKTEEDYRTLQNQEVKINGSRIKIDGDEVQIREASFIPKQEGEDNRFNKDSIRSINGETWDGDDFIIEYSPFIMGIDPSNGIQKAPWLIIEVETDDGNKDLGYISNSAATSGVVETVTKGEIADLSFDQDKKLEAIFKSGKTVTEGEIGKIEIINNQQ